MRRSYGWTAALAALLATVGACDDDDPTGPVQPAAVAAASSTAQDGTAGATAMVSPVVRVSDGGGRPVAGALVTFAVTAGGGAVAATETLTDAGGLATAGTWTLGRTAGDNVVTATVSGLPAVAFTAHATPGPAAYLAPHAGDDQSVLAGRAVPVRPAVRVADAYGNAVAGVPVSFAVSTGGGAVTGGTATTDASGVAAVGSWTLGAPGANTLTASVGALHATFAATSLDPCAVSTAYGFGETAAGELGALDCRLATGQRIDFFSLALPEARSFVIDLAGGGNPFLYLFDASGRTIATDDDGGPGTNARIQVLGLPAASYFIGASGGGGGSEGPALSGAYTVRTSAAPADLESCTQPWVVPGLSTTQQLTDADNCPPYGRADRFQIYLHAGQTVTIRETSPNFDTLLLLLDPNGSLAAYNDDADGLNSRLTFTAPVQGAYMILAASFSSFGSGAYTLTVQ